MDPLITCGAGFVGSCVARTFRHGRKNRSIRGNAIQWLGLVADMLATSAVITVCRASFSIVQAISSGYAPFSACMVVCTQRPWIPG